MKPCCKNHLQQVVHYLTELFEEEKIKYWLHFGTLLSAIRENGKVISWDSDTDLGILATLDQFLVIQNKIKSDGYMVDRDGDHLFHINYSNLNWNYCDVFLYHKAPAYEHGVGDSMSNGLELDMPLDTEINSTEEIVQCHLTGGQLNHTIDFPYWFIEETEQLHFENRLMHVPRHPNKFIEFLYGPNWKTPVKKKKFGYCGNYYPLSYWLDYAEFQREVNQTQKITHKNPIRPYCRIDTPKCDIVQECCVIHEKELMSFVLDTLRRHKINFTIIEDFFVVKFENYNAILKLEPYFNKHYFIKYFNDKVYIFYSKTNQIKVVLYFQ